MVIHIEKVQLYPPYKLPFKTEALACNYGLENTFEREKPYEYV